MTTFCPKCGTARIASFRYCRSCGLDFDELPPMAASRTPAVPPSAVEASVPPSTPVSSWDATRSTTHSGTSWGVTAGQTPAAVGATDTDPGTYRLLTMLAWLVAALLLAWLALVQFGFVGTFVDDGTLVAIAAWNALVAVLITYGAVRLQRAGSRSSYRQSAIWAIVIVVLDGFQIVQGITHFAFVGSTIAAAGAGILAWLTYQALPAESGAQR